MSKRITLTADDIALIERLLTGLESEISVLNNGKIYLVSMQRIRQLKAKIAPNPKEDITNEHKKLV